MIEVTLNYAILALAHLRQIGEGELTPAGSLRVAEFIDALEEKQRIFIKAQAQHLKGKGGVEDKLTGLVSLPAPVVPVRVEGEEDAAFQERFVKYAKAKERHDKIIDEMNKALQSTLEQKVKLHLDLMPLSIFEVVELDKDGGRVVRSTIKPNQMARILKFVTKGESNGT